MKTEFLGKIKYRVSLFISSWLVIGLIFFLALNKNIYDDPTPTILPITPTQYRDWGSYLTEVKVGLYVNDFSSFDMLKGAFILDATIWFECNATIYSLDRIGKFSFGNGKILHKKLLDTKLIKDKLYARYSVLIEFVSPMNYRYFPLDNHRITLLMKNDFVSPADLILESHLTSIAFSPHLASSDWFFVGYNTQYGYISSKLDSQDSTKIDTTPVVAFYFDFQRSSSRRVSLIFLPLLFTYLMALAALIIDAANYHAIAMPVASLTAMLAYRYVVDQLSPVVGYFMLSDYVFILTLLCTFILFMVSLVFAFQEKPEAWHKRLQGGVLTVISIFFSIVWAYLLLIW